MIMTGQKFHATKLFLLLLFSVTYFKLGSLMPIENTYAAGWNSLRFVGMNCKIISQISNYLLMDSPLPEIVFV